MADDPRVSVPVRDHWTPTSILVGIGRFPYAGTACAHARRSCLTGSREGSSEGRLESRNLGKEGNYEYANLVHHPAHQVGLGASVAKCGGARRPPCRCTARDKARLEKLTKPIDAVLPLSMDLTNHIEIRLLSQRREMATAVSMCS